MSSPAVKLKKYPLRLKQIVLFLTFALALSCGRSWQVSTASGKQIPVTASSGSEAKFEAFVLPYRQAIDRDMNKVLTYNPVTLDKSQGAWQTAIGNVMADATLEKANFVLHKRNKPAADFAMLNFGGIRSVIPAGNVTVRTAFEVMPFENSLYVVELQADQVKELIRYIIAEKKAHPISGLTFMIDKDNNPQNIYIAGKPFWASATYRVVTSDYLVQGGDRMDFFTKGKSYEDLDYKLRNVLIDYFADRDTLRADLKPRIVTTP